MNSSKHNSSASVDRVTSNPKNVKAPPMVLIPGGPFFMGTSTDQIYQLVARDDWAQDWFDKDLFQVEEPYHEITLPDFEIGQYPVTNLDYFQFVWESGYRAPRGWMGLHPPSGLESHPVVGISRKDALAYIDWLNKKLIRQVFRLPNEAEWEKATRGTDGRTYPWGNEFDPWRCNTIESGKNSTTPVGSYSPGGDSQYGVADVIGNVWEWTTSYLLPYPFSEETPPADPKLRCVVRGGAWYYSQKLARCACREGVPSDYISTALGFRLARTPVPNPEIPNPP
jgi:toxoflavin biosynthesis protein ToxD